MTDQVMNMEGVVGTAQGLRESARKAPAARCATTGKAKYPKRDDSQRDMRRLFAKAEDDPNRENLKIYTCPFCGCWHIQMLGAVPLGATGIWTIREEHQAAAESHGWCWVIDRPRLSREAARQKYELSAAGRGQPLCCFLCAHCRAWHLTKNEPESGFAVEVL